MVNIFFFFSELHINNFNTERLLWIFRFLLSVIIITAFDYTPQVRSSRFSRKLLLVTYLTRAQQTGLGEKIRNLRMRKSGCEDNVTIRPRCWIVLYIHRINHYPADKQKGNQCITHHRVITQWSCAPVIEFWTTGARQVVAQKAARRSWLRLRAEVLSTFGQHRKFQPHARKTS